MPVKGAAGTMLADARAAVRNNASRRVIDPVICVLKMRPLALPRGYAKTSIKQAQISPPAYRMLSKQAEAGWTASRCCCSRLRWRGCARDRN
jgi:hypothetical protein